MDGWRERYEAWEEEEIRIRLALQGPVHLPVLWFPAGVLNLASWCGYTHPRTHEHTHAYCCSCAQDDEPTGLLTLLFVRKIFLSPVECPKDQALVPYYFQSICSPYRSDYPSSTILIFIVFLTIHNDTIQASLPTSSIPLRI